MIINQTRNRDRRPLAYVEGEPVYSLDEMARVSRAIRRRERGAVLEPTQAKRRGRKASRR